ncbi:MAG TPA: hypoxanthine phosphoribosyltransferase [Nitrospiria bacterium]|jgi:hypoxanthine phosphoribosyltransferase|nr:hypoxanthine phosphoribosyltransferase [Nitrospiria bacterium]
MERIFGKPIIDQEGMHKRIRDLGRQITNDYEGRDLLLVGVLKGAYAFYADLARAIQLPLRVDFLVVTSSESKGKGSEKVKIVSDLTEDIKGQDVLLVEDIVDSGLTVSYLKKILLAKRPRSLKVCTLLDKPNRRKVKVAVEYIGFSIPNKYVVGYGLDYQNKYRNLPYIAVLDVSDEDDAG